jgi:NADPH:quinone reductase-like Zn-dependent oxidoreductase
MKSDGRVAYPNGVMPEPKAASGVKVESYNVEPSPQQFEKLNRLIESGPFEVHVARTFPLDKAADAHRELDKHYLGKLALHPQ